MSAIVQDKNQVRALDAMEVSQRVPSFQLTYLGLSNSGLSMVHHMGGQYLESVPLKKILPDPDLVDELHRGADYNGLVSQIFRTLREATISNKQTISEKRGDEPAQLV